MQNDGGRSLIPVEVAVGRDASLVGMDDVATGLGDHSFHFTYHRVPFAVHVRASGQTATIDIDGNIGPMPFSAESPVARTGLKAVLDAANGHLGEIFRVVEGRIRLGRPLTVENPVTSVRLMTALATFLIPVKPYLEAIEVFVSLAGTASSGEATIRPGWRRSPGRTHSRA